MDQDTALGCINASGSTKQSNPDNKGTLRVCYPSEAKVHYTVLDDPCQGQISRSINNKFHKAVEIVKPNHSIYLLWRF